MKLKKKLKSFKLKIMSPKEKAEELVTKMLKELFDLDLAKQCALIAVDEIINTASPVYDSFWPMNTKDYWKEVKQEITNL